MKQVAAAIVIDSGRVLVTRRAAGQNLAGFWEFPGGKLEAGEDAQTCVERELLEELGVASSAGEVITIAEHSYPGGCISLIAVQVSLHSRDFTLSVHDDHAWIDLGDLLTLNLAPADIPIGRELIERYGGH